MDGRTANSATGNFATREELVSAVVELSTDKKNHPSLKSIAQVVGTSPATVSSILRKESGGTSAETRYLASKAKITMSLNHLWRIPDLSHLEEEAESEVPG